MSRKNMVRIDESKLMAEIARKGLRPLDLSEELGHNRGYLQDCSRSGKIGLAEARLLEKLYGIRLEWYEWVENEQKELPLMHTEQPDKGSDINKDILTELYDIIKRAVKDAIREEREANE